MSFETQQNSRWLAMLDITAKRTVEKQVADSVSQHKCLICGTKATGRRGLCTGHYLQFNRTAQQMPGKERLEFEQEQIREGRILASGQIRQMKNPNPFKRSG